MTDSPIKKCRIVDVSEDRLYAFLRALCLARPHEEIASRLAEALIVIQKTALKDILCPEVKKGLEEDIERCSNFVSAIMRDLETLTGHKDE